MDIILAAIDNDLADAWERYCGSLTGVRVHRGSILEVQCDAYVSPANSFGFMDGGIDRLYIERFGAHVQDRLRIAIRERHHGELLVGAAEIVETDDVTVPYIIAAPTMRVPMVLSDTVNPYLAARAALLLIEHASFSSGTHSGKRLRHEIRSLAIPGLGTGVGSVGSNTCAHQVRAAIEEVLLGRRAEARTWAEASERHQLLYTANPRRLQY